MAARWSTVVVLVVMIASFRLPSTAAQTRHIVGGALGWTIPPGGAATYTTWAAQQTFTVGDTLFFNFTTGLHNVAEVSQSAYGPCTSANTLSLNSNGPATVTLTSPGTHYYVCTVTSHCQIGQKLSVYASPVTVSAAAPQSAPGFPPFAVATSPSTDGEWAPVGSPAEWSPTGSPISPPSPSASPVLATVVPVSILAAALAFFY